MKINHKKWFLTLAGFGQGFSLLVVLGMIISIVVVMIDTSQIHYERSLDDYIFRARPSIWNDWTWSLFYKIFTIAAALLIYLGFKRLYNFGLRLDNNLALDQKTGRILKKMNELFFAGILIRPIGMNALSFIDFFSPETTRYWHLNGSLFFSILTLSLIALFIHLIADLIIKAGKIREENDLTI